MFEVYPLDVSYRIQLARHLCEINNYSCKPLNLDLPSSSQRPMDCYPTDRIILQNDDDSQIRTDIYVSNPAFQKVEDLVDDNLALEQYLEDYNAQLMEELLHKMQYPYYPYYHLVYGSLIQYPYYPNYHLVYGSLIIFV